MITKQAKFSGTGRCSKRKGGGSKVAMGPKPPRQSCPPRPLRDHEKVASAGIVSTPTEQAKPASTQEVRAPKKLTKSEALAKRAKPRGRVYAEEDFSDRISAIYSDKAELSKYYVQSRCSALTASLMIASDVVGDNATSMNVDVCPVLHSKPVPISANKPPTPELNIVPPAVQEQPVEFEACDDIDEGVQCSSDAFIVKMSNMLAGKARIFSEGERICKQRVADDPTPVDVPDEPVVESPFSVAGLSMNETLHQTQSQHELRFIDVGGSPYCGYAAVMHACGIVAKEAYLKSVAGDGSVGHVALFARSRGYNICITDAYGYVLTKRRWFTNRWIHLRLVRYTDDGVKSVEPGQVGHYLVGVGNYCHWDGLHIQPTVLQSDIVRPLWHRLADKRIILSLLVFLITIGIACFIDHYAWSAPTTCPQTSQSPTMAPTAAPTVNGNYPHEPECIAQPAHFNYLLVLEIIGSIIAIVVVLCFGYSVSAVVTAGPPRPNSSDMDMRTVSAQREELVHQDSVQRIRFDYEYSFYGYKIWRTRAYRYHYDVSTKVFLDVFRTMQIMASQRKSDVYVAVESIGRFREVNTNASSCIMFDTGAALTRIADLFAMGAGMERPLCEDVHEGSVSYAESPETGYIPALDNIRSHQEALRGGRSASGIVAGRRRRFRLENTVAKPVGCFPLGCFTTSSGPVKRRGESVTRSGDVMLAVTRAQGLPVDAQDEEEASKLLRFAVTFMARILDDCDFSQVHEPRGSELIDLFNQNYAETKSAAERKRMLYVWQRYLEGTLSTRELKKAIANGFHIKGESNLKINRVRPRGIMTMGDIMLFRCLPVLILIRIIYKSELISRYQIKGMDTDEMVQRITEASHRRYMVTDYSSFEASIHGALLRIEQFTLLSACRRAGFADTHAALSEYFDSDRLLKTQWGKISIRSRCSGDFWTSFGNGLVSICVMAYCHSLGDQRERFTMIAEGDDGFIPSHIPRSDIITKLGLKWSSSTTGAAPGDTVFLQGMWEGGRVLNVGRVLASLLFVRNGHKLKRSKQLFILRCKAYSLWQLSKGCPVLSPLIVTIGKLTSGMSNFKGSGKFLNQWKGETGLIADYPRHIEVVSAMRDRLHVGAVGVPPISYSEQLYLERMFSSLDPRQWYLGDIFHDCDEVMNHVGEAPGANPLYEELIAIYDIDDRRTERRGPKAP